MLSAFQDPEVMAALQDSKINPSPNFLFAIRKNTE